MEDINQENQKREFDIGFINHLHDEKIKTQSERANYVIGKLAFVIGFFGLGSLKIDNFLNLNWLLFFVPVIAICYDLYVNAANSSIKKKGSFIRNNKYAYISALEKQWELYSAKKRDVFAPIANFIVTIVITIASCLGTYISSDGTIDIWILWYVLLLIIEIFLWVAHQRYISKLDQNNF